MQPTQGDPEVTLLMEQVQADQKLKPMEKGRILGFLRRGLPQLDYCVGCGLPKGRCNRRQVCKWATLVQDYAQQKGGGYGL